MRGCPSLIREIHLVYAQVTVSIRHLWIFGHLSFCSLWDIVKWSVCLFCSPGFQVVGGEASGRQDLGTLISSITPGGPADLNGCLKPGMKVERGEERSDLFSIFIIVLWIFWLKAKHFSWEIYIIHRNLLHNNHKRFKPL